MNERIRKLMLKADRETVYHTDDGSPYLVREFDVEKFAELIVEECLDLVSYGGEFCSRPKLVEKIKQHFGVEE